MTTSTTTTGKAPKSDNAKDPTLDNPAASQVNQDSSQKALDTAQNVGLRDAGDGRLLDGHGHVIASDRFEKDETVELDASRRAIETNEVFNYPDRYKEIEAKWAADPDWNKRKEEQGIPTDVSKGKTDERAVMTPATSK